MLIQCKQKHVYAGDYLKLPTDDGQHSRRYYRERDLLLRSRREERVQQCYLSLWQAPSKKGSCLLLLWIYHTYDT